MPESVSRPITTLPSPPSLHPPTHPPTPQLANRWSCTKYSGSCLRLVNYSAPDCHILLLLNWKHSLLHTFGHDDAIRCDIFGKGYANLYSQHALIVGKLIYWMILIANCAHSRSGLLSFFAVFVNDCFFLSLSSAKNRVGLGLLLKIAGWHV